MPSLQSPRLLFSRFLHGLVEIGDQFVPAEFHQDPEQFRKSRLIVNFGLLGGFFGLVYAIFYWAIGHPWGAGIVLLSTLALLGVGLAKMRNLLLAGNLQSGILIAGFVGLAAVEGGVQGHAVGWLATVPISALVLADVRSGIVWFVLALAATVAFSGLYAQQIYVPIRYPARWHTLVTSCGYVSLTLFAGLLGFIIESGRRNAFRRMERALEERARTNAALSHLNEEKTHLLQVVAHDLRSPLQVVLGHGGLIADGLVRTEADIHESAAAIVSIAYRMNDLIGALLDLRAMEAGETVMTIAPFDLAAVVQASCRQHLPMAEKKGIALSYHSRLETCAVRGATEQTVRILENLISNALKYSEPGTVVRVELGWVENFASVDVVDEGPGLSAEDQQKLFRRFTKLTARPTGGEASTGLGLSIARELARAMGGEIVCHSILGMGATFSLRLLLAD